jgi:hypothetical protein
MMGTYASLASVSSLTSEFYLRSGASNSKKCSLRLMCLGATSSASISELGPLTPNLKEPNVNSLPPDLNMVSSSCPSFLPHCYIHSWMID